MSFLLNPFIHGAGAPPGGDPNFANVVLLVSMLGANGGTTFTDESNSGHTLTSNGGNVVTNDTNPPAFQASSAQFSGGLNTYISVPDSADWHFGSGDFTVEGYIRSASTTTQAVLTQWSGASNRGWGFFDDGNGLIEFFYSTTGADAVSTTYNHGDKLSTWVHVAFSRVGNTGYLCYDGVIRNTRSLTGVTLFNSTSIMTFGANNAGTSALYAGREAEWRITKGVGRYSGAINDPISVGTVPFPRS